MLSLSFEVELRESHEKGLVSFRVGGGGGGCDVEGDELEGGAAMAASSGPGLLDGEAVGGDQGIAGKALVMLLRDRVLLAWLASSAALTST